MSVDYKTSFKSSLADIEKLIETPNRIQEFGLNYLKAIDASQLSNTEKRKLENSIQALENISTASLKESFHIIYSQLCVLAVSSLSATIEKHFINYANSNWQKIDTSSKKLEELKISLKYLVENNLRFSGKFGKLIVERDNSIKFQDLNSIVRTYKEYFSIDLTLEESVTQKVVFYQQVRHIIVHKGSVVDGSFLNAVAFKNANINKYKDGDMVSLNGLDWESIKEAFAALASKLPTYVQK
jgi:hypothetical protein